ncbi:MAG: hypothetical protein JEZ07_08780 [Phycisphaerae bacterium]|nr:hypothetical protein [Phycisphaerae bacterium]
MDKNSTLDSYIKTTIEITARKLIGKCGITRDDLEDIQSEMMLDVIRRIPKHDNLRWSIKTFIPHIVNRKAFQILRHQRCSKTRIQQLSQSMDAPRGSEYCKFNISFHDIITEDAVKSSRGNSTRSDIDHVDLRHDIQIAIRQLSPFHQQCCYEIMNSQSIAEVSQKFSMVRGTFYARVIKPIREVFTEADLKEYLI